MPDTDFKNHELIARAAQTPAAGFEATPGREDAMSETREQESRASTMPRVSARDDTEAAR